MSRRALLSAEQRDRLFAVPTDPAEMARHYVLGNEDLALIRCKRRGMNRLGFAVQLCLLRYPGQGLGPGDHSPEAMIAFVAAQISVPLAAFADYAHRDQTRREHAAELHAALGMRRFGFADWRTCVRIGAGAAWATDRGEPVVRAMLEPLRTARVLIPAATVVERTVAETTANGAIVRAAQQRLALPETLSSEQFWAALEEPVPGARASFERLIAAAAESGVYPEFLKSLNLKWDQPGGKTVNLGYIFKYISIWTDMAANSVPKGLAHAYVDDLAKTWDCEFHVLPTSGNWTLYKEGRPLRLREVLNRLSDWLGPMQRFIAAIQESGRDL